MANIDRIEKNLDRIHEWIRSADQKISVLLAFEGITFTLIAPKFLTWFKEASAQNNILSAVCLIIGIGLMTHSLYKIFRALIPNLKNISPHRSITFFGDIASMNFGDYTRDITNANEDDFLKDYIQQTHTCSLVASLKHANFKASVTSFLLGMGLFTVGWMLLRIHLYVV